MLAQADPSASQSSTQLVGIQHKFQRQCRTPPVQALAFFLCSSQPAGESWRSAGITSRHHSPAGWLLQGRRFASCRDGSPLFVFVGASLLANLDGQQASLHTTIRQQAGSCRGEDQSNAGPCQRLRPTGTPPLKNCAACGCAIALHPRPAAARPCVCLCAGAGPPARGKSGWPCRAA